MELIFTAASNQKYAQIATDLGYLYGARLPAKIYPAFTPHFVDQDWEHPHLPKYLAAVHTHKPPMASVLDWEYQDQLTEVLSWAEEIAPFVQEVIVIPKVPGQVWQIPAKVGGKKIRLGFSVPTSHGATEVTLDEIEAHGSGVHLLGGDPRTQMMIAARLGARVKSIDFNKVMRMASLNCVWVAQPLPKGKAVNRKWPQLKDLGLGHLTEDTCYTAFELSMANIGKAWHSGMVQGQIPMF